MCIDMRIHVRIDMCTDMGIDMCKGMSADMRMGMCSLVPKHTGVVDTGCCFVIVPGMDLFGV